MDSQSLIIVGILLGINIFFSVYLYLENSRIKNRIYNLLRNSSGKNIEESVADAYKKLEDSQYIIEKNSSEVNFLIDEIKKQYSKIGVVTYNAYEDAGGKLSFVLCLLNNYNSGILLNSLHSRNSTRLYIKKVQKGEYSGNLSSEEAEALSEAISK